MRIVLTMFVIGVCVGGCSWVNTKLGFNQDNPVEEFIEDVIEYKTGIDIDLSLDSPEEDEVCEKCGWETKG